MDSKCHRIHRKSWNFKTWHVLPSLSSCIYFLNRFSFIKDNCDNFNAQEKQQKIIHLDGLCHERHGPEIWYQGGKGRDSRKHGISIKVFKIVYWMLLDLKAREWIKLPKNDWWTLKIKLGILIHCINVLIYSYVLILYYHACIIFCTIIPTC